MLAGNKLREKNRNYILAAGISSKINSSRKMNNKNAYIIFSLKHPDEVVFLRKVYDAGFYLLGLYTEKPKRLEYLTIEKQLSENETEDLIKSDENEEEEYGQKTRDTYHLADFFLALGKI
ncbi:hypothetical protein [Entomobacter blattae]|uniref:Uncharacterized protein n=1 Tax=Entomobacter blattae TaxID=2762277 RepID=A0A7H1NPU2_9PROT|nr:hypothetical protein [Entomobacter blattae]QNT77802.1 hypothetical protein JGUZn3_05560 [Entomobacter blattae]